MSPRLQTRAFGQLVRLLVVGVLALKASGCASSHDDLVDAGAATEDGAATDPNSPEPDAESPPEDGATTDASSPEPDAESPPDADVEPPGPAMLPFSRQLHLRAGNVQLGARAHSLFLTSRGTLIALIRYDHSDLDSPSYSFYARRSVDDGVTWSAPMPLGYCRDSQPTLVEDAAHGRIILLYDHPDQGAITQLAHFSMRQSDDDGATFGEPFTFRVVVPAEVGGLRLTSSAGIQLKHGAKRGHLLVLAQVTDQTGGRLPGLLWSDDGGHSFDLTYGSLDPVSGLGAATPPMSVVESSDGALLISTVAGPRVARALSLDQETFEALPDWSPGEAYGLGNVARYDPAGARLLQIGTAGDGALSLWSSRDGGEHWGDLVVLRTLASASPQVVVTPRGTIGALHQVESGVAFTSLNVAGLAALEECDARCAQKEFAVSVSDRLDLPVCAGGARVVDWGVDETGDALVDDFEAVAGNVFCDSEAGAALVRIDDAPPGAECAMSAKSVEAGYDADRDGTLSSSEVAQRFVRCPDAAPQGEALLVGTISDVRALSVRGDWVERRFALDRTWDWYRLSVTPRRGFLMLEGKTGFEWSSSFNEVRRPNGAVVTSYPAGQLRWSPDETSIAIIGSDVSIEPVPPPWLTWLQLDSGESRRIDDEFAYTSTTTPNGFWYERAEVAFSPDGAQLAYKDGESLYLVSSYEAAPTLLAEGVGAWGWSYRDGQCSITQQLGEESVILHAYACEPAELTNDSRAAPTGCSWSASGARLLCQAHNALFTTAPDGSGRVDLTTVEQGQRLLGDWLGGSDRLYYVHAQAGLHIVNGDGTGDRMLARLASDEWPWPPSVSRDGRYLAYNFGTHGLFLFSVEEDTLVRLPAHHRVVDHAFP